MRAAASVAAALAMLAGAQPASAQIAFVKCHVVFTADDTGEQQQNDYYYGFQDQAVYYWTTSVGLQSACAQAPGQYLPCEMRVTDSEISIIHHYADGRSFVETIDRLSAEYRARSRYETGRGTCAKTADPRTAPRAF